jgi:hypothetical protein
MVRKIFEFSKIIFVMVYIMRYITVDGQIQAIQIARGHRVSENFKIDEEWEKP